ncbi:hypothetical protein CPLU01_04315 [Colletotrichum plurivorum]|uniref:Uncharacterized protein n=1 Tax=Colletotrichum plurivorum TaxID=2175906 RepID=A0A8H6NJA1_9PEZI|nr:hypothetical protein CPLU01_04315 [Colletotrichum plurivorum]
MGQSTYIKESCKTRLGKGKNLMDKFLADTVPSQAVFCLRLSRRILFENEERNRDQRVQRYKPVSPGEVAIIVATLRNVRNAKKRRHRLGTPSHNEILKKLRKPRKSTTTKEAWKQHSPSVGAEASILSPVGEHDQIATYDAPELAVFSDDAKVLLGPMYTYTPGPENYMRKRIVEKDPVRASHEACARATVKQGSPVEDGDEDF